MTLKQRFGHIRIFELETAKNEECKHWIWPTFSSLLEATAVVVAVAFGIVQVLQLRQERRRQVVLELMRSFQTPAMLNALLLLDSLPEGRSSEEVQDHFSEHLVDLQVLFGTWESIGILVRRHEVPLDLVDDFYSGSIVYSWKKLGSVVKSLREDTGRETHWEYFQFLSQQMIKREKSVPPVPAYIEYRDWRPKT